MNREERLAAAARLNVDAASKLMLELGLVTIDGALSKRRTYRLLSQVVHFERGDANEDLAVLNSLFVHPTRDATEGDMLNLNELVHHLMLWCHDRRPEHSGVSAEPMSAN